MAAKRRREPDRIELTADEVRRLGESRTACLAFRLRRASRAATAYYDEILKPSGVRSTQLPALIALSQVEDSVPMQSLARMVAMDRTSLTRLLGPLLEADLIAIRPGEDQRKRLCSLTDEGRRCLRIALPLWEEAQAAVDGLVGASIREAMLGHLIMVERHLSAP
jgi:DNA-binding MarR family transcriptional regulator